MSHTKNNEKGLLQHIGNMSKRIVEHHHRENLAEFLLYDVCSDQGFGIRKAAYLVNNPDFACLKGVAGHYNSEAFGQSGWENPRNFTSHMQQATYNNHVRSYFKDSLILHDNLNVQSSDIQRLVDYLQIDDPAYHIWNTKHNNHGLFVFEKPENHAILQDHLLTFLHILSFSTIF